MPHHTHGKCREQPPILPWPLARAYWAFACAAYHLVPVVQLRLPFRLWSWVLPAYGERLYGGTFRAWRRACRESAAAADLFGQEARG